MLQHFCAEQSSFSQDSLLVFCRCSLNIMQAQLPESRCLLNNLLEYPENKNFCRNIAAAGMKSKKYLLHYTNHIKM